MDAIFVVEKECIFKRLVMGEGHIFHWFRIPDTNCSHVDIQMTLWGRSLVDAPSSSQVCPNLLPGTQAELERNSMILRHSGCGYPDVQTRVLLSRFSKEFPSVPIYGIADWDPHG